MENAEVPTQKDEVTAVAEPVVEDKSKTDEQPAVPEDTPKTTDEQPATEETSTKTSEEPAATEAVESNQEEDAPATSTDEQENVTDTNTAVPPTSVSPNRVNVPLKEVNESEKEEPTVVTNGTENGIGKKRELEQEDEKSEVTNDNEERNGDQSKKIKISECSETPIEVKEAEINIIPNGNTAVEV